MQLGSGTWGFKPTLTYIGESDNFFWGTEVNGSIRLGGKNKSGFAFDDFFPSMAWGIPMDWLATTVRGTYTGQGEILGRYPILYDHSEFIDPFGNVLLATPINRPEHRAIWPVAKLRRLFVYLGIGVNVTTIPHGAFAGNSLKFEWLCNRCIFTSMATSLIGIMP